MQRIALRNEDERTAPDSGAGAERRVILVFPASVTEYEQARVEVEASPRPPVETKPDDRDEDVTPAGGDGAATAETPGDGYYVVTSDSQRRAWGLPDLANETAAHGSARRDADTIERHDRVPVVNPARRSTCSSRTVRTSPTTKTATGAPSERAGAAEHTRPPW